MKKPVTVFGKYYTAAVFYSHPQTAMHRNMLYSLYGPHHVKYDHIIYLRGQRPPMRERFYIEGVPHEVTASVPTNRPGEWLVYLLEFSKAKLEELYRMTGGRGRHGNI